MENMSPEDRISRLEARLQLVEDELAISRLMMTYAPAADGDLATLAASLWTDDGTYEINGMRIRGRAELQAFFEGERHQFKISQGCAHPSSPPRITVSGDTASAICYQHLARWDGEHFTLPNYSVSLWEFARQDDGWRVTGRVLRLLNGDEESRRLLAEALGRTPLG
jgi:ketosteroid isomerase-like protein